MKTNSLKKDSLCKAKRILIEIKPKHVKMFKEKKSNLPLSRYCPVSLAITEQYSCYSSVTYNSIYIDYTVFIPSLNLSNAIRNFDNTGKFKYGTYVMFKK